MRLVHTSASNCPQPFAAKNLTYSKKPRLFAVCVGQVSAVVLMQREDLERVAPYWLYYSVAVRNDPLVRHPGPNSQRQSWKLRENYACGTLQQELH